MGNSDGQRHIQANYGTPQGGVFSPLLANIALNSLDWWLDEHGAALCALRR
uniref:Reverse transcriptase (RNA-dependent DNA polymerase) n=1 Tax=Candidatus Kentrum sp. UNK TaxID=2126344 RepID=A0A451ASS7_9GAMM|nr:MAG: Reverse transcriptase (RNA-dependent DNA polymerase) [Candidatus Kentron sp. UNK]VFK69290.1 MAG: Reverse transcriptase (RNA-dependent DNA polymerase) [Candidatus Kentron sp. UNK]